MSINSRTKGASGEREFAVEIKKQLNLEVLPQRNLEQVRSGGADIIDVPPFVFEVKRCESLSKRKWWLQVRSATEHHDAIPVVCYRQNRQKWRYLISANHIGLKVGFIELEEIEFWNWARNRLVEISLK